LPIYCSLVNLISFFHNINYLNIEVNLLPLLIFIYSEINFIKPLDDVKIQRKIITFTEDGYSRTIFINKMINSGIMWMFIFFYNFYIYIFYCVSQVLCICTDYICYGYFSMRNYFFICNDFIFLLFNNLMRNRHCIWIETGDPQGWFFLASQLFFLFFTFLFNYFILLL
jgi:hypothetical protein